MLFTMEYLDSAVNVAAIYARDSFNTWPTLYVKLMMGLGRHFLGWPQPQCDTIRCLLPAIANDWQNRWQSNVAAASTSNSAGRFAHVNLSEIYLVCHRGNFQCMKVLTFDLAPVEDH